MFERDDAVPPDLAKVPVPRHALEVIPILLNEREDVGRKLAEIGITPRMNLDEEAAPPIAQDLVSPEVREIPHLRRRL